MAPRGDLRSQHARCERHEPFSHLGLLGRRLQHVKRTKGVIRYDYYETKQIAHQFLRHVIDRRTTYRTFRKEIRGTFVRGNLKKTSTCGWNFVAFVTDNHDWYLGEGGQYKVSFRENDDAERADNIRAHSHVLCWGVSWTFVYIAQPRIQSQTIPRCRSCTREQSPERTKEWIKKGESVDTNDSTKMRLCVIEMINIWRRQLTSISSWKRFTGWSKSCCDVEAIGKDLVSNPIKGDDTRDLLLSFLKEVQSVREQKKIDIALSVTYMSAGVNDMNVSFLPVHSFFHRVDVFNRRFWVLLVISHWIDNFSDDRRLSHTVTSHEQNSQEPSARRARKIHRIISGSCYVHVRTDQTTSNSPRVCTVRTYHTVWQWERERD